MSDLNEVAPTATSAQQPTAESVDSYVDEFVLIEVEPAPPVKVKLNMSNLKWGDMKTLQRTIAEHGNVDEGIQNLEVITTIMNKVLVGQTVDDLPVMTFQRVMRFVMTRMQAMSNQGN